MSSAGLRRWLEASRYSEGVAPLMTNPYIELTNQFNHGRRRALVSSGQAVVLRRLAIMSKDGDWNLREDQDSIDRVLEVLAARGARYRFGAPLDLRWLAGGWSSHFEFVRDGLRLRTDFRHATAAVVGITTESAVARRRRRRAVKSLWRCRRGMGSGVAGRVAEDRRPPASRGPPRGHCAYRGRPALRTPAWRGAVNEARDEFLSEEDLDLRNLSDEELFTYWTLWLQQAQATNDEDAPFYSHGVFERDPAAGKDRE